MEIERINENTVKFYISYLDIEERGFNREEIWYNRERSEQLFWEMMDEVRDQDDFFVDGPLWIQVQALEKGIEVIVTKAQISKDGQKLELPLLDKIIDIPLDERLESLFEEQLQQEDYTYLSKEGMLGFLVKFSDFEDVIALSHRMQLSTHKNELYMYEGRYYLYVEFDETEHDEEDIDMILSILLEYGEESAMTIYRIQEYGKQVMGENALDTIHSHFPPLA